VPWRNDVQAGTGDPATTAAPTEIAGKADRARPVLKSDVPAGTGAQATGGRVRTVAAARSYAADGRH